MPLFIANSPIHSLDPRIKLILTVAFILTCALTPVGQWAVYVLLFTVVLSVVIVSELGVGYVLKRAALAFPFVLAAAPLVFTAEGARLFTLPIGQWTLSVSQAGLERFLSIAVKSWLSLQAAIVLSASTPFPDLLFAMRAVRVPRLLVAVFGLMWRYLFVLADEALRLMRARVAQWRDRRPTTACGRKPCVARAGDGRDGGQPVSALAGARRPHLSGDGGARLRRRGARFSPAACVVAAVGRAGGRVDPADCLAVIFDEVALMHHTIEIEHLSFAYPDGHKALNDVSLKIAPCEKVALVGPNGAGKTTLMLHLNGILRGKGKVCVSGIELSDKTLGRARAAVGLVFQSPDDQLFSPTVYEDVAFGPMYQGLKEAEVRERVTAALKAVRMGDYAQRISHHLSVGEKKRIAIATVLAMNPDILVLDEPSAGLDPRARRGLINLLRELPQTILCSTHDLRMVRELFPRTVVMDCGRIAADDATEKILADERLLEAHGLERP